MSYVDRVRQGVARAATSRCRREARRDPQRAARRRTCTTPRSRRSSRATGPISPEARAVRTNDGTYNDVSCPRMGSAGMRFGRNVPLSETFPDTANLLNAEPAHGQPRAADADDVPAGEDPQRARQRRGSSSRCTTGSCTRRASWTHTHDIPVAAGDSWHERPMRVPRTPADLAEGRRLDAPARLHQRELALVGRIAGLRLHDVGAGVAARRARRQGAGRRRRPARGRPGHRPARSPGSPRTRWIGQSLLHGLFALEHNAICDRLKRDYPTWDDERLFQQARLINAALMAKIHTVEWTPAILPNTVIKDAMSTNWHGALGDLQKVFTGLNDNELLGGIPGSPTDHHTAPVLADRGVRVRLPHALADAGRLHDPVGRRSARCSASSSCRRCRAGAAARCCEQFELADLLYSLRRRASGRVAAAQLPAAPAEPRPGQRRPLRPRHRRHPARPRARRAPLQPVPPAASTRRRSRVVRGADRQPAVGGGDPARLQQRPREGRPDGRPDGRAAAGGLRLQRDGVPRLRADGLAPPEERPLPLEGLPSRGLHEAGHRLGREQRR